MIAKYNTGGRVQLIVLEGVIFYKDIQGVLEANNDPQENVREGKASNAGQLLFFWWEEVLLCKERMKDITRDFHWSNLVPILHNVSNLMG